MKDFYDEDVDFPPKKEKAPKKRKGDAEDEDEGGASSAAPKAKKEKAAKKEPAEPEPQVGDGFGMVEGGWEDAEKRKELVAEITKTAIDRGVRLPVGSMSESMIKQVVGGVMMANRSDDHNDVDVGATLNALKERFGRDPPPLECACDANAKLATLFAELASYSFKTKDQRGGIAYRKVRRAERARARKQGRNPSPGVGGGERGVESRTRQRTARLARVPRAAESAPRGGLFPRPSCALGRPLSARAARRCRRRCRSTTSR
jgi:hypothetical protein